MHWVLDVCIVAGVWFVSGCVWQPYETGKGKRIREREEERNRRLIRAKEYLKKREHSGRRGVEAVKKDPNTWRGKEEPHDEGKENPHDRGESGGRKRGPSSSVCRGSAGREKSSSGAWQGKRKHNISSRGRTKWQRKEKKTGTLVRSKGEEEEGEEEDERGSWARVLGFVIDDHNPGWGSNRGVCEVERPWHTHTHTPPHSSQHTRAQEHTHACCRTHTNSLTHTHTLTYTHTHRTRLALPRSN